MKLDIVHDRLRKEHSLPDDFVFFSWEALPKTGKRLEDFVCTQITGGQCPTLRSGKNKGKPNYRKATNVLQFIVTNEQVDRWESEYEHETGNCRKCCGTCQVVQSMNFVNGTVEYRPCSACNATGKSRTAAVPA